MPVGRLSLGLDITGRIKALGFFIHLSAGFIALTFPNPRVGYIVRFMVGSLLPVKPCPFYIVHLDLLGSMLANDPFMDSTAVLGF